MATLYITEFARQGRDACGHVTGFAEEPAIASQTLDIGESHQESDPFNTLTSLVRLSPDEGCNVEFAVAPEATVESCHLAEGEVAYFALPPNSGYSVSVISGVSL